MKEFVTSSGVEKMLHEGKIIGDHEKPHDMFRRVVDTVFNIEKQWQSSPEEVDRYRTVFENLTISKAISLGSPVLTNAGRDEHNQFALSSCVVIPVDLRKIDEATVKIKGYYQQNMGSGFDFTPYENPVQLLLWLNELADKETQTGRYDRYIGNIGNLHISHPKIREFIGVKRTNKIAHFNISVDIDDAFMQAVKRHDVYQLADGTSVDAATLLHDIAESAHYNGDPGILSLERMNRDNPLKEVSPYTSVPPCSEMGLAPGETCQFGYINLSKFVVDGHIDYKRLFVASSVMTRALDNAIEIGVSRYPDMESSRLALLKRKIGIGVCGLADTFIQLNLPYGSEESLHVAKNMLSCINYASKATSVTLSEQRGSCQAMQDSAHNEYYHGFIEERYAHHPTDIVSTANWEQLAGYIRRTGHLRNILTTALPPTGRTSILLGVTPSIEPLFSTRSLNENTQAVINDFVHAHADNGASDAVLHRAETEGTFQTSPLDGKEVLRTVKEISAKEQLDMIAAISGVYDEAVSKTVNLPRTATVDDVASIFMHAYDLGLKNISVYRDGSYENQPVSL